MNKDPLYYEKIGNDFSNFMSEYDVKTRANLIGQLLSGLNLEGSCLEVGCGTGRISELLADRFSDLTVSDISSILCTDVAERLQVKSRQSDACDLSFEDETFDFVISSECIEHTPNPKLAITEMLRVLKPNGIIILTSPNKLWYPALVIAQLVRIRKYSGTENWIFPSDVIKLMSSHGMHIEVSTGCHLFPWQIPGAKRILPFFDKFGERLSSLMINYAFRAKKISVEDTP